MNVALRYGDGPQAVYDNLRARIITGEIAAGEELKILSVAAEHGISTVTVREAVRMLAADKLIELRPRRSPIVVLPDLAEILEINEIRMALEPIALRAAMPNHSDESLAKCREIIEADKNETEHWGRVELNRSFHLALLEPSGKPRLLRTIDEQYEGIARLAQYLVIDKTLPRKLPHVEHSEICEAVQNRDARRAVKLLKAHIQASTERVVAVLESQEV